MFNYMLDYFMQPFNYITTSQVNSVMSLSSDSSSRRTFLSSSRPEFRPIHSEIIRRHLVTYFLEASSLPVNVSTHRSRESSANMFCASSLRILEEGKEESEWLEREEEEEGRRRYKKYKRKNSKICEDPDLMFLVDL